MRISIFSLCAMLGAAATLAGCASAPRRPQPADSFAPAEPSAAAPEAAPGTIYRGSGLPLFMDLRAHDVGDVLTIQLVENTDASKETSTSTSKGSSVDTGLPTVAGRTITAGGKALLDNTIKTDNSFAGKADASQSNHLDGSITVTVAEKLANGNLRVRGEKWLTLNQGQEYIRISGLVRPVDIGPDNTIASTKVADAKIAYTGRGALAEANRQGWLSRFFSKPWFPL